MTPLPLHMGALHGIEWLLMLLLTFGPLLALVATVVVVRRRDEREADEPTPTPTHPIHQSTHGLTHGRSH